MTQVQTNIVFTHLESISPETSIIVEQGGSRSGKTYNILIWLISKAVTQWDNKVVDIVRKSFPSLRQSAMFDFLEILKKYGLYSEKYHNKTENIYKIGTNTFRFFSCDDSQKMRGPGRDILFCNEANELSLEDFRQLNMRTKELTILDYNPSDEYHWIYDQVLVREDVEFYKTTFNDNPFLPDRIKDEIKRYKDTDENYWRIYGLGERGVSQTTIFTNWELTDEPKPKGYNAYGLDFGFNDPNALVDVVIVDCEEPYIWIDELLYQPQLTTPQLIQDYIKPLNIPSTANIYGDNARPETIQEIYSHGFNIYPCSKGKGSIKAGIDWIKRYKIKITKRSHNLLKEIKAYRWKVDKDGKILDEPVDLNNHAIDALRYSLSEKINQSEGFGNIISFNI